MINEWLASTIHQDNVREGLRQQSQARMARGVPVDSFFSNVTRAFTRRPEQSGGGESKANEAAGTEPAQRKKVQHAGW